MEGYEVVTSDDQKLGHVVEIRGGNVIIEHGHLKKTRHAVPRTFAWTDDSENAVRLSVSKELVCSSPKVNGEPNEQAIAEHYGLAAGTAAPDTEGYGETVDDDPARSAERDTMRAGMETPEQERARIRESDGSEGLEESPGLLGDRLKR
jgi:hypothetical protein